MQNQNQMQNNNQNQQEKVFTKMLRAGGKNYFFDIKQASNGSNYLTISESYKKQTGESVTNHVMLFKDHANDFISAIQEAGAYLK